MMVPKLDGMESVATLAHVAVPMVSRLAKGTSPTPGVAVPCCRLACELGGASDDVEVASHEPHPPMDLGNNESRPVNPWAWRTQANPVSLGNAHTHTYKS